MKGKIAFVLGAAVGYVLGTRAGRERYEQIKRGAETVWNTAPVQRGAAVVRDAAQTRVDELKTKATRAGKNAMAAFLRDEPAPAKPAPAQPEPGALAEAAQTEAKSSKKSTAKSKSSSTDAAESGETA